jgi:hypothetical protein
MIEGILMSLLGGDPGAGRIPGKTPMPSLRRPGFRVNPSQLRLFAASPPWEAAVNPSEHHCFPEKKERAMLSLESSVLTRLLLARHTSICRAMQLDATGDILTLLKSAPDDGLRVVTAIDADKCLSQRLHDIETQQTLLPVLLSHLEERIAIAWARLDQVSPSRRQ